MTGSTLFDIAEVPGHPARFTPGILVVIERHLEDGWRVLDPFAGTGGIHRLRNVRTVGVELQPRWAAAHPRTLVGNALYLPFRDDSFDAVVTSPAYGNRMADHHEARDDSKRLTYRHQYGEQLHPDNGGAMPWGKRYRAFHEAVWAEARRVLKPSSVLIVNVKDHEKDDVVQPVVEWHRTTIIDLGFRLVADDHVPVAGMRFGANYDHRLDHEHVLVFQAEAA